MLIDVLECGFLAIFPSGTSNKFWVLKHPEIFLAGIGGRALCGQHLLCVAVGNYLAALFSGIVGEDFAMSETNRGPQLSVPIDPEMKARLEAAAEKEDRSVSSYGAACA